MKQLDAIRFPLLGERENGEPFEYLLLHIEQEKVLIGIYDWMVNRVFLDVEEKISLYVPNLLSIKYEVKNNDLGIVKNVKQEDRGQTQIYEVELTQELNIWSVTAEQITEKHFTESSLLKMLIQYIKDSLILKQGIIVYLKHLAPYFSRIVDNVDKNYSSLKEFMFEDLKNKIIANEKDLQTLYNALIEIKEPREIPITLNLEYLRENIESEISLDLFLIAFSKLKSRDEFMKLLKDPNAEDTTKVTYYYMDYIFAIKLLEKRLYSNYNQIVAIYLKFI